jgi:zinc D-Ala-D-Ala carboxypeptidase
VRRLRVAGLLAAVVVVVALAAALGGGWAASPSSTLTAVAPALLPRGELRGNLGEADGAVPDGATVFDDAVPGVARLEPALLAALRRAAGDAAGDGVDFVVDSGWRSAAYQEHLLQDAVAEYGSEEEAARWVARPDRSAHVSGDAIDLGREAAAWLSRRGAAYGLCPIYDNEPWHYELRPEAAAQGCPSAYADPTHDPRMRQ